jgi:hypothetical protein
MRNKEQKRDLSVQAIAGLPTIGMIPTKLFQGWNARLPAQRGYFTIHGVNDYSIFPDLEGLKNDIRESAPTN